MPIEYLARNPAVSGLPPTMPMGIEMAMTATVDVTVMVRLSIMPWTMSSQRAEKLGWRKPAMNRPPRSSPSMTRAQLTSMVPSASAR
ncbi:hypothetical protein ACFSKM_20885 [Ancylobacter dichloromethanicus]